MDNLIKDENGLVKTGEFTAVNPQFLSQTGLQQAQSFAGILTTISSDTLSGTATPMNLKSPEPLTGADGLLGTVETGATSFMDEYNKKSEQNQALATLKAKSETSQKSLLERMGLSRGETALTDQEYSKTVDPLEGELKSINQDILEEQNSLRKQLEAIDKVGTLTDVQKQAQGNALKRQSAAFQADLYIKQLGIQGRYDSAKAIADRKIAMVLEKDKQDLEILKFDYEDNKEIFTKAEQRQFETMWAEKERALNAKEATMKTFETTRLSLMQSAAQQQAPQSVISAIANSKTAEEAISAAGQYAGDVLEREYKKAQINKIYADIANSNGSDGNYNEKQLKAITKLNQDVSKNATYSKTTSMRGYADNVVASLSQTTGVGDIAAINQFQKVIDEGAVTRDQDVVLIQSAQSLVNSLKTKIKKLEKGEVLSPDLRQQMRMTVESLYDSQVTALSKDPYIQAKSKEAELYGLTTADTILGELGGFNRNASTTIPYKIGDTGELPSGLKFEILPD